MDIAKVLDKPLSTLLVVIGAILILGSFLSIDNLLEGTISGNPEKAYLPLFVGLFLVLLGVWLHKNSHGTTAMPLQAADEPTDMTRTKESQEGAEDPPDESRKIEGTWESEYKYEDTDGEKKKYNDTITISQNGSTITGTSHGDPDFRYKITGSITHSHFLTGNWKELNKRATNYGVFQLKISARDGENMVGKWLGIPKDDESKGFVEGSWKLKLISDGIDV